MGMFEKQSRRLKRPGITSVKQLAQEVWAVLNSTDPIEVTSPMVMYQNGGGQTPLTLMVHPNADGTTPAPIQSFLGGPPLPPIPPFAQGTVYPPPGVPPNPPFVGMPIPGVNPHDGLPGWNSHAGIDGAPAEGTSRNPAAPPPIVPYTQVPIVPTGGGGTTIINVTGGNTFDAVVVSKVSGSTYSCAITFFDGTTATANCVARNVDSGEVLPAGLAALGQVIDGTNYIYPPVFYGT
jgi:hypothetical protein